MIYLDNGATSMQKPAGVYRAMQRALENCGNPGRGGHRAAMEATRTVFSCRERAGKLFDCAPEQVVFTANCTHGLNIAIHSLVKKGSRVVISGFEHNAVTRPLHALGANVQVAGRKLFDREDTLSAFADALSKGADAVIFTHVSNVFGYILPVEEIAKLCRQYAVPFIIDAAQSAGSLPVRLGELGANYIAMPGHKGLLGPQGTGLLLCGDVPKPLICGGTGSESRNRQMPEYLPDRAEAGTPNVPGIAGLEVGLAYLERVGVDTVFRRQQQEMRRCADGLKRLGYSVFSGEHQGGTLSFLPDMDCELFAEKMGAAGVALRAGLHCAPLAHESAGTLETGTVRVSYGHNASAGETNCFLQAVSCLRNREKNLQ